MPVGDININRIRRGFAIGILFLLSFACVDFLWPAKSAAIDTILELTSSKDHHFLGPFLYYFEDPQKKLTIDDVTSPQTSAQYARHTDKLLNLGLNSYAYWIRFTVIPSKTPQKWLLSLGWPSTIDHATLYMPDIDSSGWKIKEVGRSLPTGPDRLPGRPADLLFNRQVDQPVTIYLRVESSDLKLIPLQIFSVESYRNQFNQHTLWLGDFRGPFTEYHYCTGVHARRHCILAQRFPAGAFFPDCIRHIGAKCHL